LIVYVGRQADDDVSKYEDELNELVGQLNQQASSREGSRDGFREAQRIEESQLATILSAAIQSNASDILLVPGVGVAQRINGKIRVGGGPALSEDDIRSLVLPLLNAREYGRLQKERSVDLAFQSSTGRRFRANVHYQQGKLAAAVRVLPRDVPRLASLDLPPQLAQLAALRRGLVIVTGPTGSGKSSTLAAFVDEINRTRECHVVTVEEPVEYVHANRSAIVEQIEVGIDAPSFNDCLRSILRQSPDVILVGEMRDAETISLVLTAAETGHLVLSTLHTNDAAQSISRIVDSVQASNQAQIRQQLSLSLAAIVTQQLVPSSDGGRRYAACEILFGSDAVRHLIRQGEDHQIRSQILLSRAAGMITMEQSLAELVRSGSIREETALSHSFRQDEMKALLSKRTGM
jgi:twitching motility protein PilT